MKNFFDILTNIWKIEELRERILLTLFLLAIYRIGAQIVLPGIDPIQLSELADRTGGGGLLGVLNMFTGGAFANASVFALGDYALHFCIYCSTVNGNSNSIFTKIAKRW